MPKFVEPTDDLIKIMAEDMRDSDVVEVMTSHGHTPLEALRYSFVHSDYTTILVNSKGVPFAIFGVAVINITTGIGSPWLLSTNEIFNNKKFFLDHGPLVIADMVAACPRLVNYVHHANQVSIDWLKSLGFTIENPAPYGVKGDLFHKFHMEVV